MSEKESQALAIVKKNSLWAAGIGLLPMPLVNIAGIAAFEGKMLYELSKLYEIPFREDRVKSVVTALVGGAASTGISYGTVGAFFKTLPFVGPALMIVTLPAFAGAVTYAIGKVFIMHFESGGTFLDFKPEAVKEYFREQFEAARSGMTGQRSSTPPSA